MWPVSASASGFAGDEGTPRNGGRGGRADAGRGGRPAAGGNPGRGDPRAGDLSQEEILDLVVEAMLAAGGPGAEDDDLGDDDGVDAGSLASSLWGTRCPAGPPGTGGQDSGPGAGFGSGQPLDVLRPGPVLARAADRVHTSALRRVSDDELTGMIKAWRRLTSWATARELGAIAEFARRRPEEDTETDFARHARARRAASGPPQAATRAGSAQTAQPGANPAAQAAPADGTAGANPAAQAAPADGTAGANPAAQAAPAAPAGGALEANPATQAPAAAPAGGANPAAPAEASADGRPGAESGFPEVISPFAPDGDSDPPPSTGGKPPGTGGGLPGSGGSPPGSDDGPPGSGDGPGGGNRTPRNAGGGRPGSRDRPGESAPGSASPLPALNLQASTFIQRLGVRVTPLAAGTCEHRNQEPGYTPSPRLRHLITARTVCCTAPGCRHPAARCDFDHTIAYQAGGRTCECNVRPPRLR